MTSICRSGRSACLAGSCRGTASIRPMSAGMKPQVRFSASPSPIRRLAALVLLAVLTFAPSPSVFAQTRPASSTPSASAALVVTGAVGQDVKLNLDDLRKLPRKSVTTKGHDDQMHRYDGVPIAALLAKAGVPLGSALRGKSMALAVVAEGSDGYRAAFSLAELDDDFAAEAVLIADSVDGQPLGSDQGPLRLVVPGDKRQGRWVRMLKSITVVNLAGAVPSN
jgi:DMSO/TMAO reductase YedYZ molybdopterin-dependent catalytic subunit